MRDEIELKKQKNKTAQIKTNPNLMN